MKKKSFIFFLLFALLAFIAGYFLVQGGYLEGKRAQTSTILDKFSQSEKISDNSDSLQLFSSLSENKVVSISNSTSSGEILYYEKNTGKIYKINLESGEETSLSDIIVTNFIGAIWSPNKKDSIQLIYSPKGTRFRYFNFVTGESKEFDQNVKSIVFSPNGEYIAYYILQINEDASEEGRIYISQPNGKYQKFIFRTRIANPFLSWPIKDKLQLATESAGVFLLSEEGKLDKLMESFVGFDFNWSKSGKKILFSVFDESDNFQYNSFVALADTRQSYQIKTETIASRCAWSIDDLNLYCAVAKSPTEDELYRINTEDKKAELIAQPGMQIGEFILSTLENYVIFTGASDNKIYSLKIAN